MSDYAPLWTRDAYQRTNRHAEVLLVCFSAGPLTEGPRLDARRFGVPSQKSVEMLDIRRQERTAEAAIFDGWREEPLRTIAARDLGDDLALLDAADQCHLIRASLPDQPDLGYVQAAWAVARWMCLRGATVVFDGHAVRFHTGEKIMAQPADAPLDIKREVGFVFEPDVDVGADGHFVHTRGMIKLARPDVVAVCGVEDVDLVVEIMRELAAGMARGLMPEATRHGVELSQGLSLYLGDPRPGLGVARLHLNNDATLLSLAGGEHLIGVMQLLRESMRPPPGPA